MKLLRFSCFPECTGHLGPGLALRFEWLPRRGQHPGLAAGGQRSKLALWRKEHGPPQMKGRWGMRATTTIQRISPPGTRKIHGEEGVTYDLFSQPIW